MSEVRKYRKKPVVIEAWQLSAANGEEIAAWINDQMPPIIRAMSEARGGVRTTEPRGALFSMSDDDPPRSMLFIPTPEGVTIGSDGDYVIRGVAGEFYACKPDIFALTYEPAEATHD